MKHYSLLMLTLVGLLFCNGCKKDSSSTASNQSLFPAFSVPLSDADLTTINTLMKQGKVTNPRDFLGLVDSIKVADENNLSVRAVEPLGNPSDYTDGTDQVNSATSVGDGPSTDGGEDYSTGTKTINTRFQSNMKFVVRGNTIQVVVPFTYDLGILADAGTNTITNLRAFTPVQILPTGSYWGTVTQGATWYVNGGAGADSYEQSAGIDAYGSAQEVRTYLRSVQGGAQISTNANVGAFTIGAQLSANFTIQSATNTYNQYSMNADGYIYIQAITYGGYGSIPTSQFQGTISADDYGILRNQ
jgi:hypothetical protein